MTPQYELCIYKYISRDSLVSIAGPQAERKDFDSQQEQKKFWFSTASSPDLVPTQPLFKGYEGSIPGGKAAGAWS
jgi:hypothetical protein